MERNFHIYTASKLLLVILNELMSESSLMDFRLVGGTALALQRGHRKSIDIDLYTDADYGSVNFTKIEQFLANNYKYIDYSATDLIGFGRSYFVGTDQQNSVKLDLYYSDQFIHPPVMYNEIRMASVIEILAMKLDAICRGGRKKDFWVVHEMMHEFELHEMIKFHQQRYPYSHDPIALKAQLTNFDEAEKDFDPICLRGKIWEVVQKDLIEFVETSST